MSKFDDPIMMETLKESLLFFLLVMIFTKILICVLDKKYYSKQNAYFKISEQLDKDIHAIEKLRYMKQPLLKLKHILTEDNSEHVNKCYEEMVGIMSEEVAYECRSYIRPHIFESESERYQRYQRLLNNVLKKYDILN